MAGKKEKLSCNVTKETLFIGVGGIGSKIVRRVAESCKGTETDKINFVVMDTNANDLRAVKNSGATITHIQTSSTQSVLDYLKKDDDARNNWFPNNTTLYPKTVSEGAGQVRAISRLALNATIKTGEIQKLYKAIDDLFLKDGGDLKQALRVVIVSTAAGGTGSGIAMTTGMLIREYLHKHYREKAAIIRGYVVLPGVLDTVIRTETEKESLRRNGYATIKEINAFMIKASGFCSVRKELERYKDLYIDIPTTTKGFDKLEGLPFDFCFLLDRTGQSQESMQTLDQYLDFAAKSLYEQNIGPMEKDAFGIEDNIIKEFANGDNLGRNRFGGIGASTLRYPYADIIDYVAYAKAIDCIGDGESVGEWLKYDKAFRIEKAEYKKNRSFTKDPEPTRASVYMKTLENGEAPFDTDIKGLLVNDAIDDKAKFMSEIDTKVDNFITAFEERVLSDFLADGDIDTRTSKVEQLQSKIDFEKHESDYAAKSLKVVRDYQAMVKRDAPSSAKTTAKSILYKAPSINNKDLADYNLEKILVGTEGAIHPNAMRYILYVLSAKLKDLYEGVKAEHNDAVDALRVYGRNVNNKEFFDVQKGVAGKDVEKNFDDVVKLTTKDDSILSKIGGMKAVWDKLNNLFPAFATGVIDYRDIVLKEQAYGVALEYVNSLSEEFEVFYDAFERNVIMLSKEQQEIVDKLKFRDGDCTAYVCAKKEHLDRIAEICATSGGGLMLPSDLNAKIYDAVKMNAENKRVAAVDTNESKPRIDIFKTILIEYFKDTVTNDCDDIINIDVIKAISQELEFNEFFKLREEAEEGEPVFKPEISDSKKYDYLRDKFRFGNKLAAPGIGCANFNEPRDVLLCAYNYKLDEMRDLSIPKIVEPFRMNATGTKTVSKYDICFFNALYNITPDMLARFKSPEDCKEDEQYSEEPGIYYKAYHDYIKNIGPDSTKSSTISLHIDKRWDALVAMPEISLDAHYNEMLKIHSALIYGIVHGMIITHPSSRYDAKKRIFALEDTEGDRTSLVVSNNTECDEFYEVLDALYRDRASVSKIYEMQEERCKFDIETNRRYSESAFVRDTANFKIGDGHDSPTSIFEIPLAYYNSLPRSKMDDNEVSIMIDSVISVLEKEVSKYEQEVDRDAFLASRLEAQFKLLIKNFDEYDVLKKNSTLQENRVVNMVFRKVTNKLKRLGVHKVDDRVEELRALIK
ncbi:MAG: hypothetical protein J6D06_05000 [Clostridia bacterium]|nr:hypothetical protein [Clostridia bacterium]